MQKQGLLLFIFIFNFFIPPVFSGDAHVQVNLISEAKTAHLERPFWVAIRMKMDKGWHTYWKNPGEAGLPISVEWDLPPGFDAEELLFPYPHKIIVPPIVSYGYEGEIFLLNKILPSKHIQNGENVVLQGLVKWMECADVCIPAEQKVSLPISFSKDPAPVDSETAALFSEARFLIPIKNAGWEVSGVLDEKKIRLTLTPPDWFSGRLNLVEFFSEERDVIDPTYAGHFRKKGRLYELDLSLSPSIKNPPKKLTGVLVSQKGWRGRGSEKAFLVEIPLFPSPLPLENFSSLRWGWALFFSFLGGILLNLMPCVLPVLSLKVLGFIQHAEGQKTAALLKAGIFSGGVLVSFWILAGLLIFLRKAGQEVGWGFQLQSPVFVGALLLFFFLFSLNLLGVFEWGTSLTSFGSWTQGKSDRLSSFLSGVLAVIVATPCTAPFMGTALGYAAVQPPLKALSIFTMLGVGMALPYVVLTSSPGLLKKLPKPGPWMIVFKQVLGVLLFLTVLWLLYVISQQVSSIWLLGVWGSLVFLGILFWRHGQKTRELSSRSVRVMFSGTLILLTVISFVLIVPREKRSFLKGYSTSTGIEWIPFSQEKVDSFIREGKPVFIDFTAAWCLSCLVNERVVLHSPKVVKAFWDHGVIAVKADWTSHDPAITKALARYGRNGVPLYVYYAPGKIRPILLPAILTPEIVLNKISKESL